MIANISCSDDQSPSCKASLLCFYRELSHNYAIAFFRDHLNAKLAICGMLEAEFWQSAVKKVTEWPQWKENFIFTLVRILKYQCWGSGSISVFHRLSASGSNWNPTFANPPDLRTWFFIYRCPTLRAVALKRPIFNWKKRFANLTFAYSSTPKPYLKSISRDTVLVISCRAL
jgi:hypothetical protein